MGIILPPLCFLKNNLQRSAEIAVVTIDITDLKELSASSIDAGTLEYEHIRGELKGLEKVFIDEGVKGFYVMKNDGKDIRFFADSAPTSDKWHSEPGVVYSDPPKELFQIFRDGKNQFIGPYSDEYGTFYSFFTPVKNPAGQIVAVVGVDSEASYFTATVTSQRVFPIIIIVLLIALYVLLAFSVMRYTEIIFYDKERENLIGKINLTAEELSSTIKNLKQKSKDLDQKVKESEETNGAILNILDDMKVQEKQLLDAKAKDDAMLASIAEGLIVVDHQGKFVVFNPAAKQMLGVYPEKITPAEWPQVFGMYSVKDATLININDFALAKAMTGEMVIGEEVLIKNELHPTGIVLRINAAPIKDEEGISGVVFTFIDMTKEKEVDKAKSEFVSLASHQLRTPLSSINWYVEMLMDGDAGVLNPEQKDFLSEIYTGNRRMVELVNALLDVSRLELGTFKIEPEPVNIVEIAESVISEQKPQIEAKKLVFSVNLDKTIPIISADKKLLRIVFQNFLSNAVKYTPESGKVSFELLNDIDKKNILLKVSDTGYGVPKGQADKIFTKLFRADNVRKMEAEGTGLGLYIVKSVVEHSGGKTWFESKENEGSTFYATFSLEEMK